MAGVDWLGTIVSVLTCLGIVGTFLLFVGKRMIAEHAVSRDEYDQDQTKLLKDIEEIRRFDGRLKGIETKVDGLQVAVTNASQQSEQQLTGAMTHVRDRIDDLKDLIEAKVGRRQ